MQHLTALLQYGGTTSEGSASLQWLRDEGAAWPDVLAWSHEVWVDDGFDSWTNEAVEWARAQGVSSACRHDI